MRQLLVLITLLMLAAGSISPQVTLAAPLTQDTGICHPQAETDPDKYEWCLDSLFEAKWNELGGLGGGRGPGYPVSGLMAFDFIDETGTHHAYGQVFERLSLTFVADYAPAWQYQVGLEGTYYMECIGPDIPDSGISDDVDRNGVYKGFSGVWSLGRWGYPISKPFWEGQNAFQYFERGRLEVHTELPGIPILAGRLGAEIIERFPPISAFTGC